MHTLTSDDRAADLKDALLVASGNGARVARTAAALQLEEPAWDMLARDTGTPMQQHAWARACAAAVNGGRKLHVLVAGRAQPTAIAPLLRPRNVFWPFEPMGAEFSEPLDFIYADALALEDLAQTLARQGMPLFFKRIFADSPTLEALHRAYPVVACRPASSCPWIPLDDTWTEPERQLNAGRRSDFRRLRRIAEKMGPVDCEVLAPRFDELDRLLDEAYQVEAASWKGEAGSALAVDHEKGAFFRRYAREACRDGSLRLAFLRIGGRAAAMQIAIQCAGGFWLLKIGYADEFARCSPGMLLMAETIRHAACCRLRTYELLGTAQPWTRLWTELERPCVAVRAYPAGMRGMAVGAADALRRGRGALGAATGRLR